MKNNYLLGILTAGMLGFSGLEALADDFISGIVKNSRMMHSYLGDCYIFSVETGKSNDVRGFYVFNEAEAKALYNLICDGDSVKINITSSKSMRVPEKVPATLEEFEFSISTNQVVEINGRKP